MTRATKELQDYRELRLSVLRRDGWRCQHCGASTNLDVHHHLYRSHAGTDEPDNLITLCRGCHQHLHNSRREEEEL